jgi:hypothetical protein
VSDDKGRLKRGYPASYWRSLEVVHCSIGRAITGVFLLIKDSDIIY